MISYNNIYKSYNGKKVISNFDLHCKAGTITCLVGKNGAGKSTLVNLAMGLLKPDTGNIQILNKTISRSDRNVIASVGYVLDEPIYIESFSAKEQLNFIGKLYNVNSLKDRVDNLLTFLELPKDNKRSISQYSSGTKTKVSLACALIHEPRVLILDEPFNGLDLPSYDKVLSLLRDYASKGNCILITSHQIDVIIETSDYVALLKNGTLHFNYSIVELQSRANIFTEERLPIKKYLLGELEEIN